jgi:hypothetical protein
VNDWDERQRKRLVSEAPSLKSELNGRNCRGLKREGKLEAGAGGIYKIKIEVYTIHLEAKQSKDSLVRNNDPVKVDLEGRVNGTEANTLAEDDSTLLKSYPHGVTSHKTGTTSVTTNLTRSHS